MNRMKMLIVSLILLGAFPVASAHGQAPLALQDPDTGKLVVSDVSGQSIDVDIVDYQRALASETICPDRIVLDGSQLATGHNEPSLVWKLGKPSRIAEASHRRSKEESIRYFRDLMLEHPNTMHYYALLPLQESAGWFKVLEWDSTPVGTVRVYLISDSVSDLFQVQLFHIVLPQIDTSEVRFVPGRTMVLERLVTPKLTWDVNSNIVTATRE